MKIGFISDLHYDVNEYLLSKRGKGDTVDSMVRDTIDVINERKLDYLFVSGDVMNSTKTIDIIKKLNESIAEVYYVVGNHDIWSRSQDTASILDKYLEDEYCLVNRELSITEDISVVGMFSWYDGSFSTMGRGKDYYEQMKMMWADGRYTRWDKMNNTLSTEYVLKAEDILRTVGNKDIILLNHFVPHKDFIVHKSYDDDWNFGNGFMGTDKIMKMVEKDKRIKNVTFGHTHERYGTVKKDGVTFINGAVGYVHEWPHKDFKMYLGETIKVTSI